MDLIFHSIINVSPSAQFVPLPLLPVTTDFSLNKEKICIRPKLKFIFPPYMTDPDKKALLKKFYHPKAFFKKSVRDTAIASVPPPRYLLLNHLMKSNQIWCVSCSHEWGMQQHIFLGPVPWGPGEGPKG